MSGKRFTIRLPEDLVEQIDHRAHLHRRTRTEEITYMITRMLDDQVKRDLTTLRAMENGQNEG